MNAKKTFYLFLTLTLLSACSGGSGGGGAASTPQTPPSDTGVAKQQINDTWLDISGVRITLKREDKLIKKVLVENNTGKTVFINAGTWAERVRRVTVDADSTCFSLEDANPDLLSEDPNYGIKIMQEGTSCSLDILRDDPRYPVSPGETLTGNAYVPVRIELSNTKTAYGYQKGVCAIAFEVSADFRPFILYRESAMISPQGGQEGFSKEDFYFWQKQPLADSSCILVKDALRTDGPSTYLEVQGFKMTLNRPKKVVKNIELENKTGGPLYIQLPALSTEISSKFFIDENSSCYNLETLANSPGTYYIIPNETSCSADFIRNWDAGNISGGGMPGFIEFDLSLSDSMDPTDPVSGACSIRINVNYDFVMFNTDYPRSVYGLLPQGSYRGDQSGFSMEDYDLWRKDPFTHTRCLQLTTPSM